MSRKSGKSPPSFCRCGIFTRYPKGRLAYSGRLMAFVMAMWIGGPYLGSARSLQDIIDRRAFSICAHPDAAPFSVRTPKVTGLQIDLAQAIARQLGVDLQEEWL